MDYKNAIRAEVIAQTLAEEDGRGFPTTVFHDKAYEILLTGVSKEYLDEKMMKMIEELENPVSYFDNMTANVQEFEDMTRSKQNELLRSGLLG